MVPVVVDADYKYPEVEIVSSIAANDTIPALERIFDTHGIPEVPENRQWTPFFRQLRERKVSRTG